MRILLRSISFLLLVVAAIAAQSGITKPAAQFPFAAGESLTYEGKLNRFITLTIGDMTFDVVDSPDPENILLRTEARSRGTLLKILRFSFLQQYESTTHRNDFKALMTTKHDVQKERVRDSVARFDYPNRRVIYSENDPKEATKPPRMIASDLDSPTQDIISAIYYLRTLPLAVGYRNIVQVSDSGLVYKIPITVTKREQQKTIFGNVWCFRVEPDIFGPNRFFEQKGSMVIWVTDDARRIPVRALVKASVGKVDIRLKEAKNLK